MIDGNSDGSIEASEFFRAVLVVLATAQGAAPDAPVLRNLAFRIVDEDGDGIVKEADLEKWVALALKHGTAPPDAQVEPRWPSAWLFGHRTLTAKQVAKKWLREPDADHDGVLSAREFETVAPSLRIHEVI